MKVNQIKNFFKQAFIFRALFDGASNTEKGKAAKRYGLQMSADNAGLYAPMEDYEITADMETTIKHNGRLNQIGYLTVNLGLNLNNIDVTEYEKIYEVSAKAILEQAGLTCSDTPIPVCLIPKADTITGYGNFFPAASTAEVEKVLEHKQRHDFTL